MQVHHSLDNFPLLKNAIVTSGTFDGVHVGHQKILQTLTQLAHERKGETVIITFFPHPRMVLFNNSHELKLLNTIDEKIHFLEKLGIDHLLIIPFTREFSEIDSATFIQDILVNKIRAKTLVIGYDHRFGKNREGSFEYLKASEAKYGFEVIEIPKQDLENVAISSTAIRNSLNSGNIKQANALLGNTYTLTGKVVKGRQLGRTLGYPTANIYVAENYKLIPTDGVYAVWVIHQSKQYKAVLNIGHRPTVDGTNRSVEVYIFDFSADVYGESLTVLFVQKIRDEQKFENIAALKAQIATDAATALGMLT
jgi:riboflavin kinase / FMN adenylyltransferase